MKNYQKTIESLKSDLGSALLSVDIWDKKSGLSMASYNPNAKATAILDKIVNDFENSLIELGFPGLNKYIVADLDDDISLVIINLDDGYMAGNIIDKSQTTLGVLFNVAIPGAIESFE